MLARSDFVTFLVSGPGVYWIIAFILSLLTIVAFYGGIAPAASSTGLMHRDTRQMLRSSSCRKRGEIEGFDGMSSSAPMSSESLLALLSIPSSLLTTASANMPIYSFVSPLSIHPAFGYPVTVASRQSPVSYSTLLSPALKNSGALSSTFIPTSSSPMNWMPTSSSDTSILFTVQSTNSSVSQLSMQSGDAVSAGWTLTIPMAVARSTVPAVTTLVAGQSISLANPASTVASIVYFSITDDKVQSQLIVQVNTNIDVYARPSALDGDVDSPFVLTAVYTSTTGAITIYISPTDNDVVPSSVALTPAHSNPAGGIVPSMPSIDISASPSILFKAAILPDTAGAFYSGYIGSLLFATEPFSSDQALSAAIVVQTNLISKTAPQSSPSTDTKPTSTTSASASASASTGVDLSDQSINAIKQVLMGIVSSVSSPSPSSSSSSSSVPPCKGSCPFNSLDACKLNGCNGYNWAAYPHNIGDMPVACKSQLTDFCNQVGDPYCTYLQSLNSANTGDNSDTN